MLPLLESFNRQLNVRFRRPLRLLYEAMQQHHSATRYGKQCPCNPVVQIRADFPNRAAKVVDARLANGPLELDIRNVFTDLSALFLR
jgi:hypothetical protein